LKCLKVIFFTILFTILLVACNSEDGVQEPIQGKQSYIGSGQEWDAEYLYDSEYNSNWIELYYNGSLEEDFNLSEIDIEIESRDTLNKGNLGDMETKAENNKITFLVGTINREMFINDEFELRIYHKGRQDKIILKAKE